MCVLIEINFGHVTTEHRARSGWLARYLALFIAAATAAAATTPFVRPLFESGVCVCTVKTCLVLCALVELQ